MCIVDKLTFSPCAHTTYLPLYPCKTGFSPTQCRCNASAPIIRKYLSRTSSSSCRHCYHDTLLSIRTDHARKYLDLEREARSLGWSSADIAGSLMEMQAEMEAAVAEWKSICGREGGADEEKVQLGAFAESIRFQFGPKPAAGKLFLFNAGRDKGFADPKKAVRVEAAKKMTRVNALRAERSCLCNIKAPWREEYQGLLRARFVV